MKGASRRGPLLALLLAAVLPGRAEGGEIEGDAARGERVFLKCYACHSVEPGEVEGLQGPNLKGVLGRPIAGQVGFDYSEAMRIFAEERGVWTADLLERFVRAPERLVPGTDMSAAPLDDPAERADLLAYLRARD